MFSANPLFQQGSMIGGQGEYRGEHRHILLSSIARARGIKYSPKHGILNATTDELLPNGNDWNQIAKVLLGQTATVKDIKSVVRADVLQKQLFKNITKQTFSVF